jgi:hypothetical protein
MHNKEMSNASVRAIIEKIESYRSDGCEMLQAMIYEITENSQDID